MQEQIIPLKKNYIWSFVDSIEVGPRREITLFVKLWHKDILYRNDHNWKQNREPDTIAPIRFGGIQNFEEVKDFFKNVAVGIAKTGSSHLIGGFGYDSTHESKANEIYFLIWFQNSGDKIIIQCQNVTEQENFSAPERL